MVRVPLDYCDVLSQLPHFLASNKETKKKDRDLWAHIEGMAHFVNDDIAEWHVQRPIH